MDAAPVSAFGSSLFQGNSVDTISPWVFNHLDNVIAKFVNSVLNRETVWNTVQSFSLRPLLSSPRSQEVPLIINSNNCSSANAEGEKSRDYLGIVSAVAVFALSFISGRFYAAYEKYASILERHEAFSNKIAEELRLSQVSVDNESVAADRDLKQAVLNKMAPLNDLNRLTSELLKKKCRDAFVDVALSVSILSAACFVAIGCMLSSPFLQCSGLILGCPSAIYALVRFGYNSYSEYEQDRALEIRTIMDSQNPILRPT